MKRNQCYLSAEILSEDDARIIGRFRLELELVHQLILEGHTRSCARLMVWENNSTIATGCTCNCEPK